jgi:hypothetical protein
VRLRPESLSASEAAVGRRAIHWPDVDGDLSTIMLIEGLPSIEYERAKSGALYRSCCSSLRPAAVSTDSSCSRAPI